MGKVDAPTVANPYLFRVGTINDGQYAIPDGYGQRSRGYSRYAFVDRAMGSVHMGVAIGRMEPEGELGCCVHPYEKGIYILEGELQMKLGGESIRLEADDYALIPFATPHALRNTRQAQARWFEMNAPQPRLTGGLQDSIFVGDSAWPAQPNAPELDDPRSRYVGHFKGQRPMIRDAAGIRGLKVFRFMEHEFGAQHFFMMRGELEVGGVRGRHDHAVEEVYLALSGEADIEIEGERYPLKPGDFAWTGVGTCHAFFQKGDSPFRWIETQAPQFPGQHASRNYAAWEKLRARMDKNA